MGTSDENMRVSLPAYCGFDEQELLTAKYVKQRNIPKSPFKVLDAPCLTDDFYLNLVDWSA
jgi:cell division cycle 20-like protein 1 (cofactor of APC complex)